MTLGKTAKIIIGALSLWPLIYPFLFMSVGLGSMLWASKSRARGFAPETVFEAVALAHVGTIWLVFGLLPLYIVLLLKTNRVPNDKKPRWAVALFLGNVVAMPVFFYLYVWPDQWPVNDSRSAVNSTTIAE